MDGVIEYPSYIVLDIPSPMEEKIQALRSRCQDVGIADDHFGAFCGIARLEAILHDRRAVGGETVHRRGRCENAGQ